MLQTLSRVCLAEWINTWIVSVAASGQDGGDGRVRTRVHHTNDRTGVPATPGASIITMHSRT